MREIYLARLHDPTDSTMIDDSGYPWTHTIYSRSNRGKKKSRILESYFQGKYRQSESCDKNAEVAYDMFIPLSTCQERYIELSNIKIMKIEITSSFRTQHTTIID